MTRPSPMKDGEIPEMSPCVRADCGLFERAAVVAWLREEAEWWWTQYADHGTKADHLQLAIRISRGDHLSHEAK